MRVAITGMGVISSLGNSVEIIFDRLLKGESAVKAFPEWRQYNGLRSLVGAPCGEVDVSAIPRSARRTMSRMSELATLATIGALKSAGLQQPLDSTRTCMIFGSTSGSPFGMESYFKKFFERGGPEGQLSTAFFKVMNHSVASNVATALNYFGPQLGVSSACSTSSQAMVLAWELIHTGLYDVVIAGGADELHAISASIFDIVEAASRNFNDRPDQTPRPFDRNRDGLAVSEGASTLILESEAHAKKRGADVKGWLLSGAYLCDGSHMSQPRKPAMISTIDLALKRAEISPAAVGYINAHATGTRIGDTEECLAISEYFGGRVPVSSLKGHLGHSLAACGGIEAVMTLEMLKRGVLLPTRNLDEIDPTCAGVNLLTKPLDARVPVALSNNFAFGGMNTSMLISAT